MRKSAVIRHYGNTVRVAEALGISQAAVSQWKEIIPVTTAHRLSELTAGELKFDPRLYKNSIPRIRHLANVLAQHSGRA